MLAEASQLQIGDTEASIFPLVERYREYKWTPPGTTRGTLGPKEGWTDPEEYERALRTYPDYVYSIELSPWASPTRPPSSISANLIRMAMNAVPSGLRSPLGLRDWASFLDIRIRDGRVSEVSGLVMVEGRSRWLNHSWSLAKERRNGPLSPRPYMIESENILMRDGRSRGTRNFITPQASEQQAEAARSWNASCLVSLQGCSSACELSPQAFHYWGTHPDPSGATREPACE